MHYRLKKLPGPLQRILSEAFKATNEERQVANDAWRAKQIQCAPGRYGLNAPEAAKVRGSGREKDCCSS
jgi:hypothetical protein